MSRLSTSRIIFNSCHRLIQRKVIPSKRFHTHFLELQRVNRNVLPVGNQILCHQIQNSWSVSRSKKTKAEGSKGKKDSKSGKQKNIKIDDSEDDEKEEKEELINIELVESDMKEAIEHLKQDFIHSVSLRITTSPFENLVIETPDGKYPLNQIAQIVMKPPNLVLFNLASSPQYLKCVEKTLQTSMGLNPQLEGTILSIPTQKVTKEYREELMKKAKIMSNNSKEVIKHIRHKHMKPINAEMKKKYPDQVRKLTAEIDNVVKKYNKEIDTMLDKKISELKQK